MSLRLHHHPQNKNNNNSRDQKLSKKTSIEKSTLLREKIQWRMTPSHVMTIQPNIHKPQKVK